MKLVFDETGLKESLYPFAQIRAVADIRIGILTIREKWQMVFGVEIESNLPADTQQDQLVKIPSNRIPLFSHSDELSTSLIVDNSIPIVHPWDIFRLNDLAIRQDYLFITRGRESQKIDSSNFVSGGSEIFIEEGVELKHSVLNASAGPIYIGKNARVMEGCLLRGPLAICEGATVKMGTRIYGATTIGPYCTVGGEIKNSVLFGFSNKGHDGYLGDSVVGEWCNLGAGTSNSNLKNSAGDVKVWNNASAQWENAGNKCGLIMGDYSRAAINTSFNTATVTGICCNIFSHHFPPKYIPDFCWGEERYTLDKAIRDINNWKKLKGHSLTAEEERLLSDIYYSTEK
jgi:UDP-N-acetylglucosamine diphosphorylase / glucose-1-phosphate thymidylyltransferase / UDP-N-acetylgalactosamine diphosphorylase / glucosamine-1-phosphate N-acetyltransferase / galactosamine-1-phosphate N-acetyltransferase